MSSLVEMQKMMIMQAENMLALRLQMPGADQSRNGAYFCVMDDKTGQVIFITRIGKIEEAEDPQFDTKADKYFCLAAEKAARLRDSDDLSSFASRDPENGMWGGAIRTNADKTGLILSCSGLPELDDEAVMLSTAVRESVMAKADADTVAQISNNVMFFNMNQTA